MSTTTADPPSRDSTSGDPLRAITITFAGVCMAAQLLGLVGAFQWVPGFKRVFEEIGIEALPAATEFALSYGLSATFVVLSLVTLCVAVWGRGTLRIGALVTAIFLPVLHVLLLVATVFHPLLRIVETGGSGS